MRLVPSVSTNAYFPEVAGGKVRNQYKTPLNFGIPNPLGPRLHNWRGGPMNEGSLYHGPLYTRPAYNLPYVSNPLFGVAVGELDATAKKELAKVLVAGIGCAVLAYVAAELLLPVPRSRR